MKNIVFVLALTFISFQAVASSTFKCPTGNIVEKGDSKTQVRAECGTPVSADYEGVIKVRGKMVYIDRWMYPKGNKYRILEFHDSKLMKIK
jgi:hypothetical protein